MARRERGAGYNPDSREVMWNEKERWHCCVEKDRHALCVDIFNEILRSHTCVYCKSFLLVSLKWTDEQSVALLKISKETKREKRELYFANAHNGSQKFVFYDQISCATNCLHAYVTLALHPLPPSHIMINGSAMR